MLLCSLVIICSYKHVSWHSTHSNIMINFSICVLIFRDMIMYLVYPGVYIYIYTHIMIVALAPTGELEGSQLDRSKKYLTYLGDRVPNVPILGLWPSAMGVLSNGTHHAGNGHHFPTKLAHLVSTQPPPEHLKPVNWWWEKEELKPLSCQLLQCEHINLDPLSTHKNSVSSHNF